MEGNNSLNDLSVRHELIADWLIANPDRPKSDCALYFNVSQAWLSTIIHSDLFLALKRKKLDALGLKVGDEVAERLSGATSLALEKMTEKIADTDDMTFIADATEMLLKANGYGGNNGRVPSPQGNMTVNQNNMYITQTTPAQLQQARDLIRTSNDRAALPKSEPVPQNIETRLCEAT